MQLNQSVNSLWGQLEGNCIYISHVNIHNIYFNMNCLVL